MDCVFYTRFKTESFWSSCVLNYQKNLTTPFDSIFTGIVGHLNLKFYIFHGELKMPESTSFLIREIASN